MKKVYFTLIPTLIIILTAVACSGNSDSQMREEKGRRQVLSDKKNIEYTTPEPTSDEVSYIIRLENKTLTLYEVLNDEESVVRAINIDPSYYPTEDIKELSNGIPAYSKEEGFLRMENFTN